MRSGNRVTIVVVLAATVAAARDVSAHRLDELLQAARIGVAEDRVDLELDLTPGMAVAERVIAEIDRDRDGSFSRDEQRRYVDGVVASLEMAADSQRLHLTATSFTFAEPQALRSGNGIIAIRAASPLRAVATGGHRIRFNNRYGGGASVYLANALVPDSNAIAVTAQLRDTAQSELTIEYQVRPRASRWWALLWSMPAAFGLFLSRALKSSRREDATR